MTDGLKIALAQLNPTVGDIDGNLAMVRAARSKAADAGADLVIYSELVITGYPPEDLVLKPVFHDDTMKAVAALTADTADGGPALLLGSPWRDDSGLYNAILLLDGGKVVDTSFKRHLPNYGVFDEKRVFAEGDLPAPIEFKGVKLGVLICEDMWEDDVARHLADQGADILVVSNGSPFEAEKEERFGLAQDRVRETGLPLMYVNQVGGQDELVFDGASFVLNSGGEFALRAPDWVEDVAVSEWRRSGDRWTPEPGPVARPAEGLEAIYQAMMTGLRDYVHKNRFKGVVLGLSGGIDSALTLAVAADALGSDAVHAVSLPYEYTSKESTDDANECAQLLGVRADEIPIKPAVEAFLVMLESSFADAEADTTEENLQARARAVTLMALSNKFGYMLVTTGNKSEMSVGYSTLYGDLCGGYSVLKDVYKTTVYALSDWRNRHMPIGAKGPQGRAIPENIITKAPSAELKPDQTDQDTLPPYDELDDILHCLVEEDMSVEQIAARGHAPDVIARIEHMLYVAEYKRRQSPPGVKITRKGFGKDRRYPIVNGYRDAR